MRIGMLVNNLEISGGYQKLVIRLSQTLVHKGHQVIIYSPKVDKINCYPDDIKTLDIVSLPAKQANAGPVAAYQALAAKIAADLDALIIHDELSLIGVALLEHRPPKVVWMLNNQLPEHLKHYTPEIKSVYKQTIGTLKTKLRESTKAISRVGLIRQGLKAVTNFVTYDEHNQRLVRKTLHRNAIVVSAGADLDTFKQYAKTRTYDKKETYTILSVGVLFPHRRYEDLISAIPYLQKKQLQVKVIIVGRQDISPNYYQKLKTLAKNKGVQNAVEFKNYVPDKEMVELYTNSDVFIFINDGFTWGISVFEAIAAHLPAVITNNIGAADLVKHHQTGWVVNPRSPREVAVALADIIEHPEKTKKITARADKKLTPFVSWAAYTDRMLGVINSPEKH